MLREVAKNIVLWQELKIQGETKDKTGKADWVRVADVFEGQLKKPFYSVDIKFKAG